MPAVTTTPFVSLNPNNHNRLSTVYKKIMGWTAQKNPHDLDHPSPRLSKDTHNEETDSAPVEEPIEFLPKPNRKSLLMDNELLAQICKHLPRRYWLSDWYLLYGTQSHGISLNTFYAQLQDRGPSIILVEDSNKNIFGGFCSESWRVEPRFYGTGETFVFTLKPTLSFYHSTGKNGHFMCSRRDFIALGGGGQFALWLDSDFENGSSSPCETFGNPCLSTTEDFKVTVIEVWGFNDPSTH